jgi:hypothetical protein
MRPRQAVQPKPVIARRVARDRLDRSARLATDARADMLDQRNKTLSRRKPPT